MDLILTSKASTSAVLQARLAGRGWHVHKVAAVEDAETRRAWNRAARAGRPVVVVNYPVETGGDADTVEAFVTAVSQRPGALYYAPRPNDFLSVAEPALAGMGAATPLDGGNEGPLDRLRKSARKLFRSAPAGSAPSRLAPSGPVPLTPRALAAWGLSWVPWHPSPAALRRDLIDRVERFFPHPLSVHVIVLNKCNLKCVMCPYHSPAYRAGHRSDYFDEYRSMTPETFEKIAEYAADLGVTLQFGQIEEVLMHKRAINYIARAKELGVPHVHLTTNGTLLTPEKASALADSGIDSVMFSVDALNADTYHSIRGDDLDRLERHILDFLDKAKSRGTRVGASFILQPQSLEERDAFLAKWRKTGLDYITFYALSRQDVATGRPLDRAEFYDKGERYPCATPWFQSVVFPDGEVSLCCKTMNDVGWRGVVSVGNLNTASLDAVWTGERYALVREELLGNRFEDFDVCSDCEIWSAGTMLTEEGPGYVRTYNETLESYTFR